MLREPDEFTPIELPELSAGESWDAMLLAAAAGEVVPHDCLLTKGPEFTEFGKDTSMDSAMPDLVVLAHDVNHVRHVLHVAEFYTVPVYVRGLASGLSGGCVPSEGGIVLDVSPLDKLISVNRANRTCRVQPGLTVEKLNQQLKEHGLWFPPWPSSHDISSIGGNIAENAGGITTVKYGTTKNWLMGLTCVLPGGELIYTGSSSVKDVAGYDLSSLICGSEGMFCAVVEAELQLLPLPGAIGTALFVFPSDEAALSAAEAVIQGEIIPRTLEFIDAPTMACVIRQLGAEASAALGDAEEMFSGDAAGSPAVLGVETDAHTEADALAQLSSLAELFSTHGGQQTGMTTDHSEALKLWRLRSELSPACHQLGEFKLSEDVAVPRDKLVEFVAGLKKIAREHDVDWLIYGHVGDGNFHATLMYADEHDPAIAKGQAAMDAQCRLAVSLGGTISGEHGIGSIKAAHLKLMRSETELALMRRIKLAFDPKGIMNPGKWL